MTATVPVLDAAAVRRALTPETAVAALRRALIDGTGSTPPRQSVHTPDGHVLVMPSVTTRHFGIKVAGVAPGNPEAGLPRITGLYLLYDAVTLQPLLIADAPALTEIRTAALSALAVDLLAPPQIDLMLVYGTGPQAAAHIAALRSVRDLPRVEVLGRTPESTAVFAAAHDVDPGDARSLRRADLVVCCTSASTPLFDGTELSGRATVVAMGAHTLDARELDAATLAGAQVVVEDLGTARREAVDVAEALADPGAAVVALDRLARGEVRPDLGRRRVFRSVGMAWEDLAVAAALVAK